MRKHYYEIMLWELDTRISCNCLPMVRISTNLMRWLPRFVRRTFIAKAALEGSWTSCFNTAFSPVHESTTERRRYMSQPTAFLSICRTTPTSAAARPFGNDSIWCHCSSPGQKYCATFDLHPNHDATEWPTDSVINAFCGC